MYLSCLNPIPGRAFLLTRVANPLLSRTFLTTAVVSKERASKDAKVVKPPRPLKKNLVVKRPLTGWMDFLKHYNAEHGQPNQKITEVISAASAQWAQLSDEEKAKYGDSPETRERIRQEAKEWRAGKEFKLAKKAFGIRRTGKPKLFNVYAEFVRDQYVKDSPLSFLEQGAAIAAKWSSLSVGEKEEFKRNALIKFEAAQST